MAKGAVENMGKIKKVFLLGMALIMCLSIFNGCGNRDGKIDVGGEVDSGKPMSAMAVRIMLDKGIFNRDDNITLKLGFGFRSESPVPGLMEAGIVVVFKIEATDFIIADESGIKNNNIYEKEFAEYSDSKFVCTQNKKRDIPNYYELFEIEPISDMQNDSGTITIRATIDYKDGGFNGGDKRLYYAASSDKIAFSAKSIADAQKKLK